MNIDFYNTVPDLENSKLKSVQFMNNVRKFCTRLSQPQEPTRPQI